MRSKRPVGLFILLVALALVAAACGSSDDTTTTTVAAAGGGEATTTTAAPSGSDETTTTAEEVMEELTFGMILVGPENDRGWSQAHREGGEYIEDQLGATMIVLDKLNTSDRPETTVEQVVDEMVASGAQLIFATSNDFSDGIQAAAAAHPDVAMIFSSGDTAWEDGKAYRGDLPNLGNIMGQMTFGKMIAGCAAALTTQTGHIAYLGPLINDETRRLVNSVFLGAEYCWENVLGNDPADLEVEVNWIGFWFNIPGFTLDPTEVTNAFFDGGADVVLSGIDTTEAIVRAGQRSAAGEDVWAIPYDFEGACDEAPEVCLGVPYFNWGPSYVETANAVLDGSYTAQWRWVPPDWTDMNNRATSMIGWLDGDGISADNSTALATFIAGLADGSIDLFVGPLNNQDGTPFLADGEKATDQQVWYAETLLEGVDGPAG
jgi:simple sugar transport system substrate-binding protein